MIKLSGAASGRALRFKILASQPGGVAAGVTTEEALKSAIKEIRALSDSACRDISDRMSRLEAPDCVLIEALYAEAHDIRAIAGTFGFAAVGSAADALCRYLDGVEGERLSSRRLVDIIVAAMKGSFAGPDDPLAAQIASSCYDAVDAELAKSERQRARHSSDLE